MKPNQRISGSIIAVIGYMLSPLSWWNDLYLNIPLAYLGAWLVSFFYKSAFLAAFVTCYWITNIAGLVLMHKGIKKAWGKQTVTDRFTKKELFKDIALSLVYTGIIIIMIKLHIIRPIEQYFSGSGV